MTQSLQYSDGLTPSTETLRRHGRSFYWAGQLLSGEQLSKAARLYSLCRNIDDLADDALTHTEKAVARRKLSGLDQALAQKTGPERGSSETELPEAELQNIDQQAQQLFSSQPLALGALRDMITTVKQDLQLVRIGDYRELLQYAYGVAGTVGVMMTCVLEAREQSRALPHAIDLGIGMQLTNIARDVLEDACLGRIYLPAGGQAGALEPETLIAGDPASRHNAWNGLCELIERAEAYYTSGWRGLVYLPPRARLAIAVAASVYREIGRQILRRGEERYWQSRSVISPQRKLLVSVKALSQLTTDPLRHRAPGHDDQLHDGLKTCLTTEKQRFANGGCDVIQRSP